jgi:hypothetical protein
MPGTRRGARWKCTRGQRARFCGSTLLRKIPTSPKTGEKWGTQFIEYVLPPNLFGYSLPISSNTGSRSPRRLTFFPPSVNTMTSFVPCFR